MSHSRKRCKPPLAAVCIVLAEIQATYIGATCPKPNMQRLNWGEISVHGQRTRRIHVFLSVFPSLILGDATSSGRYSATKSEGGGTLNGTALHFVDARSASITPRVTGNPELPSMHLSLPRETLEASRGTQHSYIPQHAAQ